MTIEQEHSKFLAHLKQLFDKLGISFEPINFPDGSELLTFTLIDYDGKELEMMARVTPDDVWLYIFGRVGNLADVDSKVQLVHSLMQLNFVTMGAKIALNEENDIVLMIATNNTKLAHSELDEILDNIKFASSEIYSLLEEY
jgi:hypothetical protein